jgi:hypothetical protein
MNTITQIESALKGIDQANFQTLIYHLLYLQGNKFIGSPGAVIGKEKTSRGTPDSFFVNEDKYIFVECTTQKKLRKSTSFFEKLSKDIDHCFKEDITTIEKGKIEKVILACNEKISVEEYNILDTKVKSYNHNTNFEILNIQNLPLLIFDIPKLAETYLNIQIIKGHIYPLEQFLLKTEKGLQPSLTNEFIGREEEIRNCIEALKSYDILLLSGGAGVGKSKLAVKILLELSKEDYIPIVIQSSGVSLWDDYQHLFLPNKKYLILFDDANKSITNLNYLLNKLEATQSYLVKVIITSRDYVKKQISLSLENYNYKEFNIAKFKDEEILKIIIAALPYLQYESIIRRNIIDLAKGNARVALMATYSISSDSETNYLDSPVLLYEKYFSKISEEIGVFNKPIILKSIAIVSFFGILNKNDEELKKTLSQKFDIDWNELWSAIIELHHNEILDVYANEVVKVSDQVLATYVFYKCYIDNKSAVINYAKWITAFIEKYPQRISFTLIDINNTFVYHHVKDLVLPHLNEVIKQMNSEDELYAFYNLFWFYKGRNCLLYLKKWIESLPQEEHPKGIKFGYVHNNHTYATKHFELLKNFWNNPNELLKPSIELTLTLLNKQPSRLPEILKFIHEDFQYKLEDIENGFLRQNILLDILLNNEVNDYQKLFTSGIFLNFAETLLGWHYQDYGPTKGRTFTIYNFDLYKSEKLTELRKRILNEVYNLFDPNNEQIQHILNRIIYPMGDIDKTIYIDELPIYQKIISDKLDNKQYMHCKFVSVLAKHLNDVETVFPENWCEFIESDIRKLSKFLKPAWEYKPEISIQESEREKRKEIDEFIKKNEWQNIENFLLNVDSLYNQQKDNNSWQIESSITDIYISLARKDKSEFENALNLFFSKKVLFPIRTTLINVVLQEKIMKAKELSSIIKGYDFQEKSYWESVLLALIPENQVNKTFLILLINIFQKPNEHIYIHNIIEYLKYSKVFESYKKEKNELKSHNIITYLTSLILLKKDKTRRDLGFNFFTSCAKYFKNQTNLLKNAFWHQYETDSNFDYDGKELKAVLELDKYFINQSLKDDKIGLGFSSKIKLGNVNTICLWDYPNCEELIEDLILTILEKAKFSHSIENDVSSLFGSKKPNTHLVPKMKSCILKLTHKYYNNTKMVLLLTEVVYHNYKDWFIEFYKQFLILNSDINISKKISFGRFSTTSGSWVPVYQKEVEFFQDILKMINTLPNILAYAEHIDYFEQRIAWKKQEIQREQKNDFIDEFY